MPEFIGQAVRRMQGSSSSEQAILLVGYDENLDELAEEIQHFGTVHKRIGRTTLQVSVPESEVDRLCELDSVISVESDEQSVSVLEQENFRHQPDSMT